MCAGAESLWPRALESCIHTICTCPPIQATRFGMYVPHQVAHVAESKRRHSRKWLCAGLSRVLRCALNSEALQTRGPHAGSSAAGRHGRCQMNGAGRHHVPSHQECAVVVCALCADAGETHVRRVRPSLRPGLRNCALLPWTHHARGCWLCAMSRRAPCAL